MRIVLHFDMDAFFAACEERYNPQFRGKPIVICTSTPLSVDPSNPKIEFRGTGNLEMPRSANHSELVEGSSADPKVRAASPGAGEPRPTGRGVVSTASYAARKYGIKSAMPISQAWRLSEAAKKRGEPAAIFLTGNYQLYNEVSNRIMDILAEDADAFEQASIDEAYLEPKLKVQSSKFKADVWIEVENWAKRIKRKIFGQEGLTCSIGIGPNKLVAKIASDFKKPDGLTVVRPDQVETFLGPLPIRVIPGVGPKTEEFLHQKGIRAIGKLQAMACAELVEAFGKWGSELYRKARGISESPVSGEWEAKSIGVEETFSEDTLQPAFILGRVHVLAGQVFRRFQKEGFKSFRTVVVTVRFADFKTQTRSRTSSQPLAALEALNGEALRLILPFLDKRENPIKKRIRLIGLRVEKFLN